MAREHNREHPACHLLPLETWPTQPPYYARQENRSCPPWDATILGFLQKQGSRRATVTQLLGLRLPLCRLCSLLEDSQYTAGRLSSVKARPSAALRVGRCPSLDTRPPAVASRRKEGAQTKPQRARRSSGRATP